MVDEDSDFSIYCPLNDPGRRFLFPCDLDGICSLCGFRRGITRVHLWTPPHSPCAAASGRPAQEAPEPRFFFSRDVLTLLCRLWGFSWNRPAPPPNTLS